MSDEARHLDISDMVALVDQIATLVRSYYVALVSIGFTDAQALDLTLAYQSRVLGG